MPGTIRLALYGGRPIIRSDGRRARDYLDVEPAEQARRLAEARGIPVEGDLFAAAVARRLIDCEIWADVIVVNNEMAHVPDVNGVVEGISVLLKPAGVFVMETPYLEGSAGSSWLWRLPTLSGSR